MWTLGQRIKELRKGARLTQQDLSEGIVTRAYISQIEKGLVQPSYDTLKLLAERLECELEDIFEAPEDIFLMKSEGKRKVKQAVTHIEMGQFFQAEKIVNALYSRYTDVHDDHDKGILKWVSGKLAENKSNWEEATKYYQESIQLFENSAFLEELVRSLDSLGYVYLLMEKNMEAVDVLHNAFGLITQNFIGGVLKISLLLNLGVAHGKIGEYHSAIRLLKTAREQNESSGILYKEGQILMALGVCNRKLNRLEIAEECYQKALIYFKMMNDRINTAGTLINSGILYRDLGQFGKSVELLQAAIQLSEELTMPKYLYNAKLELVETYIVSVNPNQAVKICQEVSECDDGKEFAALSHKLWGDVEYQSCNYDEAIQLYVKALGICQEENNVVQESVLLGKIAHAYLAKQEFAEAAHYFSQGALIHQ